MTLDEFERLARTRRAVRRFRPDPIPDELRERLLDTARWAPSGYNLQPTHFVAVTDPETKRRLRRPCMKQRQIVEAPLLVAFLGDRAVVARNFARSLQADLDAHAITPEYAERLRAFVKIAFGTGPVGLGWAVKAALAPVLRLFTPVPQIPAVWRRQWLVKQVMLSAMLFLLAAQSANLATVPMEGFDEGRVKRILGVPRRFVLPVLVAAGYAADDTARRTRLPLASMHHRDQFRTT